MLFDESDKLRRVNGGLGIVRVVFDAGQVGQLLDDTGIFAT